MGVSRYLATSKQHQGSGYGVPVAMHVGVQTTGTASSSLSTRDSVPGNIRGQLAS
jgi:hypothetical protein